MPKAEEDTPVLAVDDVAALHEVMASAVADKTRLKGCRHRRPPYLGRMLKLMLLLISPGFRALPLRT